MKHPFKALVPLLAIAALCAACTPFTPRNTPTAAPTQYPQDPRFAKFTYETDDELEVKERVDSFNERIPGLGATAGHVVVAHFRDSADRQPTPDRQFWLTGVAEVPDTTITMLVDDTDGGSSLLPGIPPLLYKYVPEECTFTTVDPVVANKVLGTDRSAISLSSPAMASTPSAPTFRTLMKHPLKALMPLLAVAALAAACNPFANDYSHVSGLQDPRFAPFTYTSDRETKVQTRLDSFNERWPGMQATNGNVVTARTHSGILHALDQDPEYWLTGVATVPTTTIDTLMEGSTGDASILPGIDPRLHKFVPKNCHFSTINPEHANAILPPEKGKGNSDFRTLPISAIAVSKDCQLLVLTAIGHP